MPTGGTQAELPVLVYVHHRESFAPLSIAEAAAGLCRLVWIVDTAQPEVATTQRLLRKFGPVIDRAGRSVDEVAALVRVHEPAGITSLHDDDLLWTAQLSELLGLPFHSVACAERLTDKHAQRQALAAAGLAVPAFRVLPADKDLAGLAETCADFPYPAVLKPRRGQSSRNTLPVASWAEVEAALTAWRTGSPEPSAASECSPRSTRRAHPVGPSREEYVLEGFIPDASRPLGGDGFDGYVSVESVVEQGRVANASISGRTEHLWPFRETGFFTPSAAEPSLQEEVLRVATEAALAVGVTIGCLHTEIKLTDDGPVVIEVNGRPGGGMSELLERASGFSILRSALQLAIGAPVGLSGPVPCTRVGYMLHVFPREPIEYIDSVEGIRELGATDGVDEIVLVRGSGDRIDWRAGSQEHICRVMGRVADHGEFRQLLTTVKQTVQVSGHNDRTVASPQLAATAEPRESDDPQPLPKLLYVYHQESFAPLSIVAAARDICRVVWLVDSSQPRVARTQRLLKRFGPVIDIAGLGLQEVAELAVEHELDGVLSMHDQDLLWTARLAELLGLPFHSIACATTLTDKWAQRAALKAAGLAVPACEVIPADADAETIAAIGADFPYPAVLKPREGQSSRDTLPIAGFDELRHTLSELRARADQPAVDCVLESFVPDPSEPLGGAGFAPMVSVESVVEHGRVAHASISARTPFLWPFRETGYCTPCAVAPELQQEVMRVAAEAALAVGVTIGCLHTEIKLTDDGPVVIEVNGRPGGGMSEMLERASGFSILRTALRLAVGEPVGLEALVPCQRVGYFIYVFPPDDIEHIDGIEGLSDLRAVAGVDEIELVKGPGKSIDWREGSEAHVFHFTGTARDHAELLDVIDQSKRLVRIHGHDTITAKEVMQHA